MALKTSFRERNLTVIAVTAVIGLILAVVGTFRIAELPALAGQSYTADFTEAGGLKTGDPVEVGGVIVGKVTRTDLEGNLVRVRFTVKGLHLGSTTSATIKTGSLLGARFLDIVPSGEGDLDDTIPTARTKAPYDLSSELIGIAQHTKKIDMKSVSEALQTFSAAIEPSTEEIGPAMAAVTDLANIVNTRDEAVRSLFRKANAVTGTFRQRTRQITQLMLDGQQLLAELLARREAINQLFDSATTVANQVRGLIKENRDTLKPALTQLNQVLTVLDKNKDNIRVSIKRVSGFITPLGEGVSQGPWFMGYIDLAPGVASIADPASMLPATASEQTGGN